MSAFKCGWRSEWHWWYCEGCLCWELWGHNYFKVIMETRGQLPRCLSISSCGNRWYTQRYGCHARDCCQIFGVGKQKFQPWTSSTKPLPSSSMPLLLDLSRPEHQTRFTRVGPKIGRRSSWRTSTPVSITATTMRRSPVLSSMLFVHWILIIPRLRNRVIQNNFVFFFWASRNLYFSKDSFTLIFAADFSLNWILFFVEVLTNFPKNEEKEETVSNLRHFFRGAQCKDMKLHQGQQL